MPPLGTQLFRNHSRQYPLSAHHHKSVFSCQKFGFKLNIYSGSRHWMIVVCNHIQELSSQRTSVPELKSKEEKKLHDLKFNLQWFMTFPYWHKFGMQDISSPSAFPLPPIFHKWQFFFSFHFFFPSIFSYSRQAKGLPKNSFSLKYTLLVRVLTCIFSFSIAELFENVYIFIFWLYWGDHRRRFVSNPQLACSHTPLTPGIWPY